MKLGRLAPVHSLRTARSMVVMHATLDPLGIPPAVSDDYVSAVMRQSPSGWGVDLNDRLGCCVISDSAHQVMLHTANGGSIVIPTDQDVLGMYEAVGGYRPNDPNTDQGCIETDACQYLETTGLAGQKSAAWGSIDPVRLDHIRWAVQLFGACRLGIMVTDQMMSQFSSGEPWTSTSGNVEGGHDVPVVRYDTEYAWVVTWGQLHPVSWQLMAQSAFLEEAHTEVWPEFVRAGGTAPNGFDLAGMLAKLPQVEAA